MPPSADATNRRRPRRAVTGRALVLGTLVILLMVLLASPLNRYFGSRSAVSSQSQQLDKDKQQLRRLNQQLQKWADPGYIQHQARQRLQYAMPGDTVYVVVDKGQQNGIDRTSGAKSRPADEGAWNTRLWDSVDRAAGD